MYVTILSGRVAPENRSRLEVTYEQAVRHPPVGLLQSFLVHSTQHSHEWLIISVWRDQDYFEIAQDSRLLEPCVQVFCEEGTEPQRIGYNVVEEYQLV